jgi:hypothetical protein
MYAGSIAQTEASGKPVPSQVSCDGLSKDSITAAWMSALIVVSRPYIRAPK